MKWETSISQIISYRLDSYPADYCQWVFHDKIQSYELKGLVRLPMKPGNIFIHHDGALGDTLLSLPCIDVIRESAAHVHIVGRRDVVHFLKEAGIADEVSSADSQLYSPLYTETLDEEMKSFLSGFDESFVFTSNTESQFVKNIRSVIPVTRAILTIPPEAGTEHAAEFRVKQCGYGKDIVRRTIMIRIRKREMIWVAEFLREKGYAPAERCLITVHPGSGGKKKCWPLANYAALIRCFVKDPRILCIVFTGPDEDAETVQMLEQLARSDKSIAHVQDAPLIRIAALFERSDFYIGNDSGISHLAGIMKRRGMVLFGPTNPRLWRPLSDMLEVLNFDDGNQSVIAEQIHMRVKKLFSAQGDEP